MSGSFMFLCCPEDSKCDITRHLTEIGPVHSLFFTSADILDPTYYSITESHACECDSLAVI